MSSDFITLEEKWLDDERHMEHADSSITEDEARANMKRKWGFSDEEIDGYFERKKRLNRLYG